MIWNVLLYIAIVCVVAVTLMVIFTPKIMPFYIRLAYLLIFGGAIFLFIQINNAIFRNEEEFYFNPTIRTLIGMVAGCISTVMFFQVIPGPFLMRFAGAIITLYMAAYVLSIVFMFFTWYLPYKRSQKK